MSQSPSAGAFGAGFQPPRPPMSSPAALRYSAAAVTAFVAAVVPCCFVHVLVSLICAAVGLSATSGGRARGRALALAAIPIALLFGLVETGAGVVSYNFGVGFFKIGAGARDLLKRSGADLDQAAASLYDSTMTSDFKGKVAREQFQAWAQAVVAKHGTLVDFDQNQSMSRAGATRRSDGTFIQPMDLRAKFTNGDETLNIVIAYKWAGGLKFEFMIDDMSVGSMTASELTQKGPSNPKPAGNQPSAGNQPPAPAQPGSGRP